MAKSNLILRKKTCVVIVKEGATAEELEQVKRLVAIGWTSKLCKAKKEKEREKHEITEEFNIGYDEVRKEDMVEYIKKFKDKEALKAFSDNAHRDVNGEKIFGKDGKRKFNMIAAKRYFYKTFFSDKWEKIEKTLESRKFKSKQKKEIQDELLALLDD